MDRWPVQALTLLFLLAALFFCWQLYQGKARPRPYLAFMLVCLLTAVPFYGFLMARVFYFGGEPPLMPWIIWAANTLWLLFAVCLFLTYYVAARDNE